MLQNSAPHPGSAVAHPDGIVTRIGTDTTKPHRWSQPPSASIRFIRSNPWLFSTCPSLEKLWIATRFRSAHFLADPILWSLNRSSALACAGGLRTTMTTNSFRRAFAPYPPPCPLLPQGEKGEMWHPTAKCNTVDCRDRALVTRGAILLRGSIVHGSRRIQRSRTDDLNYHPHPYRFIRSNPWLFSTCPSREKLWIATRFRSTRFLADPIYMVFE